MSIHHPNLPKPNWPGRIQARNWLIQLMWWSMAVLCPVNPIKLVWVATFLLQNSTRKTLLSSPISIFFSSYATDLCWFKEIQQVSIEHSKYVMTKNKYMLEHHWPTTTNKRRAPLGPITKNQSTSLENPLRQRGQSNLDPTVSTYPTIRIAKLWQLETCIPIFNGRWCETQRH